MSTFDRALDAAAAAANDCKSKTLDGTPAPVAAYVDWTRAAADELKKQLPMSIVKTAGEYFTVGRSRVLEKPSPGDDPDKLPSLCVRSGGFDTPHGSYSVKDGDCGLHA